MGNMMN